MKKKPAGTIRVKSLSKHLEILLEHKDVHPTDYWEVLDDKGKAKISAAIATSIMQMVIVPTLQFFSRTLFLPHPRTALREIFMQTRKHCILLQAWDPKILCALLV